METSHPTCYADQFVIQTQAFRDIPVVLTTGTPYGGAPMFRKSTPVTAGPRSYQLMLMAYEEAALPVPGTRSLWGRRRFHTMPEDQRFLWFKDREPQVLLYPQSFVDRIVTLPHGKRYDFNFLGLLYPPNVLPHRRWIVDFAREHFGEDSYFCITSLEGCDAYEPLGSFDHTLTNATRGEKRLVPKEMPRKDRTTFDTTYFAVMAQSRFTLCPRGDMPWSMRFFESILCGSIPIVEERTHTGRNELERGIGYRYYRVGDTLYYHEDWVVENYRLFIENQTLIPT